MPGSTLLPLPAGTDEEHAPLSAVPPVALFAFALAPVSPTTAESLPGATVTVPPNVPLPGFVPIARVTLEVLPATTLPLASSIDTCTAGVMLAASSRAEVQRRLAAIGVRRSLSSTRARRFGRSSVPNAALYRPSPPFRFAGPRV